MKNFSILRQIFVTLAAYGGAFTYGIALGWSSPAAPRLFADGNNFEVSSAQFAWIVGMVSLGATLASIVAGVLRNKFGTKITVLMTGATTAVGWILMIYAQNWGMLMVGRFLSGFSGLYGILLPLYVGEIASKEIRGGLLSFFQIILSCGEVFVFAVGHYASYLVLNIVCGIIPIIYFITFLLLPESPVFLVSKQRNEEAAKSLQLLRGKSYDFQKELNEIKHNQQVNSSEYTIVQHLKQKATRKAFIIIMTQFFFFQFTGINAVFFYMTTIFSEAQIDLEPGIASILVAGTQIFGTVFSAAFVDRFGRRFMLILSTTLMGLSHIAIGVYFAMKESGASIDHIKWLPVAALSAQHIAFGSGIGPVAYILLGELFTPNAKKVIAPIGICFNSFLAFIIGLGFPFLVQLIGNSGAFFMFAGFCVFALLFTIFFVPETKGKSLLEIQELLK